jgi:hypothetical protein
MILSINQPCYAPWCGLFERIARADVHVHLDDVQYSKNTFFNRNRVIDKRGSETLLTVPVRARHDSTFRDVEVIHDGWEVKHLRTLEQLYGKSAVAAPLLAGLGDVLRQPHASLASLNIAMTDWLVDKLRLPARLVRASELAIGGTGTERLVAMCRALSASEYYSPAGARAYLDEGAFASAGIALVFQRYEPSPYAQGAHAFVPFLSVLDPLLRLGAEETSRIVRAGALPGGESERAC